MLVETDMHRIFTTPFASVYPLYLQKVEKKGRTKQELDRVARHIRERCDAEAGA